jgi:hypothetical protein
MLARVPKHLREYFNLASMRFESILAISEIVRRAGNAYTTRLLPQILERQIERRQYVIEPGVYVAIPEKASQAKPFCEFKNDKSVRSRFPLQIP